MTCVLLSWIYFLRLCCNEVYVSMLAQLKRKVALALGREERTGHFVTCCMLCEVNVQ